MPCARAGQWGGDAGASLPLPFVGETLLDPRGMPGSWEAAVARQARAGSHNHNHDKGKLLCVLKFSFRKKHSSKSNVL